MTPSLAGSRTFTIDRQLLGLPVDGKLTLQGPDSNATVIAIAANTPFPAGKLSIGDIQLSASTGATIPFSAGGAGTVNFTAGAGGFFEAGIYTDAADVLKDLSPEADIAAGIVLAPAAGSRFVMLRAGYDANASAKGSVALAAGASVTFSGSASRNAAYGIVHQFADTDGARDVMEGVVKSWILPHQFDGAGRLPARTWLVTEVDGSFALNLGVQAGYDYSWMRQFPSGALKGDLGLRVQLAANAALGFSASGTFAMALSREGDAEIIRLRLFKLAQNGFSFALNASAGEQVTLPAIFQGDHNIQDLISAVFGVHIAQLVNDLTDPSITSASNVAKFIETRGMAEFTSLTGISPQQLFDQGKAKVDEFVGKWNALTHKPATMLAAIVQKNQGIAEFTSFLQNIVSLTPATAEAGIKSILADALSHADFFQTPAGQFIESVVPTSALAAVVSSQDWKTVQDLSSKALDILNGKTLQSLIDFSTKNLGLDVIQKVQTQIDTFNLDAWLQSKIADFLGTNPTAKLVLADVQKAQTALKALLAHADEFYAMARKAIQKKYEIAFTAGYQQSTTSTALLDASFDLGMNPSLLPVLQQAIGGHFEQLFLETIPGVTLQSAVLTHGINRQSHADLTLPFVNLGTQDVSTVLASVSPVEADGRVLVYNLNATDEVKNHSGFFHASSASDSKLALVANISVKTVTVFNAKPAVSYAYTLTKASNRLIGRQLLNDLGPLVDEYMPGLFPPAGPSFSDWMAKAAPAGMAGQVRYSFDVTLPPEAFNGWFQAPADKADQRYFAMSKAIQRRLRQMIPFYYFQDPGKYDGMLVADAVMAYGALPPSNGFDPTGARVGRPDNDIYFDLDGSLDAIVALMNTPDFQNSLRASMAKAAALVTSGVYNADPGNVNFLRITQNALKKPTSDSGALPQVIGPLLLFEFDLIQAIVKAAVNLAKFRGLATTKPADAVAELAAFGDQFVQTFNKRLGGNLVQGSALRPLGSALLLEAGQALSDQSVPISRPVGLLRLAVFPPTPPLNADALLVLDSSQATVNQTLVTPIA